MPIGNYKDFGECVSDQKSKGKDDLSARKVCGYLEQKAKGGKIDLTRLSDDQIDTMVARSAVKYDNCIQAAKDMGHTDDEAQRICTAISDDIEEDLKDNSKDEDKEAKSAGKLDDYNEYDNGADDANGDSKLPDVEEIAKNEGLKPNLDYYDNDVNNCISEQKDNGLSDEDASKFCNDLFSGQDINDLDNDNDNDEGDGSNYVGNKKQASMKSVGMNRKKKQSMGFHGDSGSNRKVRYQVPSTAGLDDPASFKTNDGDDKSAEIAAVAQVEDSAAVKAAEQQIQPFESNNKLFVKAFLMDSSVNQNQWGTSPTTLDQNIRTYIGKPLVLNENFDHPVAEDDSLQHQLELQELYRIGSIVDVVKKGTRYEAVAEITDPYARQAFKEGNLPLYVSPQLYKLDPNEPDNNMTKWTGTHLAVVKEPAYTIKKANINGQCTGNHETCVAYLKKASIIKQHGYGSCGFCNYKILTSARPKPKENIGDRTIKLPELTSNNSTFTSTMSGTTSSSNVLSASTTSANTDGKWVTINGNHVFIAVKDKPEKEESLSSLVTTDPNNNDINKLTEQQPADNKAAKEQQSNSNNNVQQKETVSSTTTTKETQAKQSAFEELQKENEKLKSQLQIAKQANEEVKNVNDTLSARVEAIENERKKERLASILQGAYKDEDLNGKLETFMKSGLALEEVESIVTPLKNANNAVKSASLEKPKPASKVTIKNANIESETPSVERPAYLVIRDYHQNGGSV